ncbi:MAG: TGS domain-containing protein [Planctomycetes bacterium]|nr:TGS domain-containing protein [Planctomycetota bacterium]
MAVNATPEYEKAEARYRQAVTDAEKLDALEEMLRLVPKHKASEKVQSDLKRKISALKKEQASGKGAAATVVDPYTIVRSGAAQVAVVGLPNTGKSSILAAVTEAKVKVESYPYSTTLPVPGMWEWQDVRFQLVDTPPLSGEHVEAGLVNLLRRAGAILVAVDASSPESLDQIDRTLAILAGKRADLFNCPAVQIPADAPLGRPGLIAVTHADAVGDGEIATLGELAGTDLALCGVDCTTGAGFDRLAETLWRLLHLIRVYTRIPGHKGELTDPFTLPVGSTVDDLARAIHRDLPDKIKFARIWGTGRHDGQQVHRTEVLADRDIVELHE